MSGITYTSLVDFGDLLKLSQRNDRSIVIPHPLMRSPLISDRRGELAVPRHTRLTLGCCRCAEWGFRPSIELMKGVVVTGKELGMPPSTKGADREVAIGMSNLSDTPYAFVSLTALLLAPGVGPSAVYDVLAEEHELDWYVRADGSMLFVPGEVDTEVRLQAGLRTAPRPGAPWKPLLRAFGLPLPGDADETAATAVVIARVALDDDDRRYVLFCFSGLSRSVPSRLTDSRFGMVVALNKHCAGDEIPPWRQLNSAPRRRTRASGDPSHAVRSVSADARGGYRHRLHAVASGPTPVAGLRLDTEVDLLRGIHVRTDDDLMLDIHGGRSLRFETPIDSLDNFEQLAEYLVAIRQRDDYKAKWEWLDYIVPVEEGPEFNDVIGEYIRRALIGDEPQTDLVLPSISGDGDGRILVSFPGERTSPYRVYPRWEDLSRWLHSRATSVPSLDLQRINLRYMLEGKPEAIHKVAVLDCLVTEFGHAGHHYLLSDGTLFRVDRDYLDRVDQALAAVHISEFPFPPYRGGTEGTYNDTAPDVSGHRLAKLDRTNIVLPGQTAVEPCDLVTDDGTLVFVKPKGASSSFSHLSTQAITAATLYENFAGARDALLDRVMTATTHHPTSDIAEALCARLARVENREREVMTACLLILGRWTGVPSPRTLPLLSRVSLYKTVRTLKGMGWIVEFAMPKAQLAVGAQRPPAA
ncbi:DUF6119 family protein [Cryptosporangium sp. NPDC048952]|uniref:DUF6119 family protein n=1 Tax=Cryptosporangium sp. NPDC048952 TaxID=3363961 RepID=UPI003720E37D